MHPLSSVYMRVQIFISKLEMNSRGDSIVSFRQFYFDFNSFLPTLLIFVHVDIFYWLGLKKIGRGRKRELKLLRSRAIGTSQILIQIKYE